jgi:hypothetical protein
MSERGTRLDVTRLAATASIAGESLTALTTLLGQSLSKGVHL